MSAISSTYPLVHLKINTQLPVFFHIIYLDIYTDLQFHESPQTELFATLGYLSDAISTEEDRGSRDLHSFFCGKRREQTWGRNLQLCRISFLFLGTSVLFETAKFVPNGQSMVFLFCHVYIYMYIYIWYIFMWPLPIPQVAALKSQLFFFSIATIYLYIPGAPQGLLF